jgi:NAD(P)-dependent dehydrogenase (short-subunit alcohol dehydrogenase family)
MNRPLDGRSALITGASQGLGFAIACAYAKAGANLLLCARDAAMLERARAEVAALASPNQAVLAKQADVSRRDDVQELARTALSALPTLQILVNNAGVYGPIGPVEDVDWDRWLQAIEINLFGSIFLCRALVPHLKANRYGKIVQLSGGGATNPLPRFSAYAASKAAVVRFAETLAEEVQGDNIDVNCIAPGPLNTRLLDEVLTAGPSRAGRTFHERSVKQKQEGGAPLSKGADLAVFLGSAASDGITGKLLSAVWDPWETLPEHRTDLNASDVYTLRRIVPDDRGFKWGNR